MSEGLSLILIASASFLLVGLVISTPNSLKLLRAFRSRRWPSVPGKVIDSRMVTRSRTRKGHTRSYKVPLVVYEYEVGGRKFTGKRICFEDGGGDIQLYPVGATVPVFYNPNSPDVCVLENGFSLARGWVSLIPIALGFFFIGVGLAILIEGLPKVL